MPAGWHVGGFWDLSIDVFLKVQDNRYSKLLYLIHYDIAYGLHLGYKIKLFNDLFVVPLRTMLHFSFQLTSISTGLQRFSKREGWFRHSSQCWCSGRQESYGPSSKRGSLWIPRLGASSQAETCWASTVWQGGWGTEKRWGGTKQRLPTSTWGHRRGNDANHHPQNRSQNYREAKQFHASCESCTMSWEVWIQAHM